MKWKTIQLVLCVLMLITWIVNLIKFLTCDFDAPYKEELIHLAGVVVAPLSMITVWY